MTPRDSHGLPDGWRNAVVADVIEAIVDAIATAVAERLDLPLRADTTKIDADTTEVDVRRLEPTPPPAAPILPSPAPVRTGPQQDQFAAARAAQDAVKNAVKRTCGLCGRTGSRRFDQDPKSRRWFCSDFDACSRRRGEHHATGAPTAPPPAPPTPTAQPRIETVASPPPPAKKPSAPSPGATARCQDCSRSWVLTGRILDIAVEQHEHKHSHIVEIIDTATTSEANQ